MKYHRLYEIIVPIIIQTCKDESKCHNDTGGNNMQNHTKFAGKYLYLKTHTAILEVEISTHN